MIHPIAIAVLLIFNIIVMGIQSSSVSIDLISWGSYLEMFPDLDINSNSYINFKKNIELISIYNRDHEVKLGVTRYLHISFEEFSSRFSDTSTYIPNTDIGYYSDFLPDTLKMLNRRGVEGKQFSWVDKGIINPPLDQGTKPISWAITTKQALDSFYLFAHGETVDIDMTNIINCVHMNQNYNGGIPYWAFQYGMKNSFLLNCEKNKKSKRCIPTIGDEIDGKIPELNKIKISTDIYSSPFIIDLQFDFFEVQHYTGGILNPICSDSQYNLSYSALVVGYGKENGKLYWIVQGTFGKQWGDNGYFKIAVTSECIKFSYYGEF